MAAATMTDLMGQLSQDPWHERLQQRLEQLRGQLAPMCRLAWQLLQAGQLRALLAFLMMLLAQVITWLRRELLALANACRMSLGMHGDVESAARRFSAEPEHIVDLLWRLEQGRRTRAWIASHQAHFLKQQQRLQADIAIRSMLVAATVGNGILFGTPSAALADAITGKASKPRKPTRPAAHSGSAPRSARRSRS